MTQEKEALEIALEALEKIATVNAMDYEYQRWAKEHLATIKEALAQPEQEPVACIGYWNQKTGAYYKPDQISAAHKKLIDDGILRRCYTTPPQRTWVGLTNEEFKKLIDDAGFTRSDLLMVGACVEQIVELVQAKLKEKNA